ALPRTRPHARPSCSLAWPGPHGSRNVVVGPRGLGNWTPPHPYAQTARVRCHHLMELMPTVGLRFGWVGTVAHSDLSARPRDLGPARRLASREAVPRRFPRIAGAPPRRADLVSAGRWRAMSCLVAGS